MESFRNPAIPAATRAVNLVRRHHNLPGREGEITSPASGGTTKSRDWRKEARANHLRAKRRTVLLRDIPNRQLPVILEISGGSNFVVLKEKQKSGECVVQFPDARESAVEMARLEEVYDGTCVFLNPENQPKGGAGGFWKALRSMRPTRETAKGFLFSLAILAGALFYVQTAVNAGPELMRRSLMLPLMGILASGCAILGFVQVRHSLLGQGTPSRLVELGFVPHFLVTAVALSGWAIVPLLMFNLAVLGYFLTSSRIGEVTSRLERKRNLLVSFGFSLGLIGTFPLALTGQLPPEMMAASVALGSYSSWLLVHCDRVWQKTRLAACS